MIDTRNATLNQRPKALNVVCVNVAVHIDFEMMLNPKVFVVNPSHVVIARKFIGKEGGVTVDIVSHEWDKVMPLTEVDGKPIGSGRPGSITKRLMAAYKKLVLTEEKSEL